MKKTITVFSLILVSFTINAQGFTAEEKTDEFFESVNKITNEKPIFYKEDDCMLTVQAANIDGNYYLKFFYKEKEYNEKAFALDFKSSSKMILEFENGETMTLSLVKQIWPAIIKPDYAMYSMKLFYRISNDELKRIITNWNVTKIHLELSTYKAVLPVYSQSGIRQCLSAVSQ